MSNTTAVVFQVADEGDHIEVRGVPGEEVRAALTLLPLVRDVQAEHSAVARSQLLRALMAHDVDVVPPATLAQVRRLATRRNALLATPVFTHETLAAARGDRDQSATRTWLTRRRKERALFTVSHEGRTLIPAFQLTPAGGPRPELRPVLDALIAAGVDGWVLWGWLTRPSSFLSGAVPEAVAGKDPERALRAAGRFAKVPAA